MAALVAVTLLGLVSSDSSVAADSVSTVRGLLQSSTDESLAIAAAADISLDRSNAAQLISAAMHRGWFDLAERLVSAAASAGFDVSHSVHTAGECSSAPSIVL